MVFPLYSPYLHRSGEQRMLGALLGGGGRALFDPDPAWHSLFPFSRAAQRERSSDLIDTLASGFGAYRGGLEGGLLAGGISLLSRGLDSDGLTDNDLNNVFATGLSAFLGGELGNALGRPAIGFRRHWL